VKGFLLDTNVPSDLTYPKPAPRVERWLEEVEDEQRFFSVVSLAEICKGIAKLPESKKRTQLQDWLDSIVLIGAGVS
jgi:toxin FitB